MCSTKQGVVQITNCLLLRIGRKFVNPLVDDGVCIHKG